MIISASYKTDIPAFYGSWFMHALDLGYCEMTNPYGGQIYRVPLTRNYVDALVFWTRNLGPFQDNLPIIGAKAYPFMVQYTITNYPKELEPGVIAALKSIEYLEKLARDFGPRCGVWRYDPIIFTQYTPYSWHRDNFAFLAERLKGICDEVIISFAHIYQKSRSNLAKAGIVLAEINLEAKQKLGLELAEIAASQGMRLSICSQAGYDLPLASCIDIKRLSDIAGYIINAPIKGNRPHCLCHQSRDIGEYDSCPQGCLYCYAVKNRDLAKENLQNHDPKALTLSLNTASKLASKVSCAKAKGAGF